MDKDRKVVISGPSVVSKSEIKKKLSFKLQEKMKKISVCILYVLSKGDDRVDIIGMPNDEDEFCVINYNTRLCRGTYFSVKSEEIIKFLTLGNWNEIIDGPSEADLLKMHDNDEPIPFKDKSTGEIFQIEIDFLRLIEREGVSRYRINGRMKATNVAIHAYYTASHKTGFYAISKE